MLRLTLPYYIEFSDMFEQTTTSAGPNISRCVRLCLRTCALVRNPNSASEKHTCFERQIQEGEARLCGSPRDKTFASIVHRLSRYLKVKMVNRGRRARAVEPETKAGIHHQFLGKVHRHRQRCRRRPLVVRVGVPAGPPEAKQARRPKSTWGRKSVCCLGCREPGRSLILFVGARGFFFLFFTARVEEACFSARVSTINITVLIAGYNVIVCKCAPSRTEFFYRRTLQRMCFRIA